MFFYKNMFQHSFYSIILWKTYIHFNLHVTISFTDNHAAHHLPEVEQIIEATGAILIYLPPYSPELNPIEEVFSIVKAWIRSNDLMFLISPDPEDIIFRAFLNVSAQDVNNIYQHCGY